MLRRAGIHGAWRFPWFLLLCAITRVTQCYADSSNLSRHVSIKSPHEGITCSIDPLSCFRRVTLSPIPPADLRADFQQHGYMDGRGDARLADLRAHRFGISIGPGAWRAVDTVVAVVTPGGQRRGSLLTQKAAAGIANSECGCICRDGGTYFHGLNPALACVSGRRGGGGGAGFSAARAFCVGIRYGAPGISHQRHRTEFIGIQYGAYLRPGAGRCADCGLGHRWRLCRAGIVPAVGNVVDGAVTSAGA